MATSFDAFRLHQTPSHSQFISYTGPPVAKPPARGFKPKNARSTTDEWHDIDQILGDERGLGSKWKDRGGLKSTPLGVETVDLTCLDGQVNDEISSRGGGDREGRDVSVDDDFPSQDERESGSPRELCIERRDESSTRISTAEGSSQENAVVIDDDPTEPNSNTDDDDDDLPQEDYRDTQTANQLEGADTLAVESLSEGCHPTGTEDTTSTPPKFTADNPPPRTSCDDKANKTVHFADEMSGTRTEFSSTIEHNNITLEINGDARPDRFMNQPTQEVSSRTLAKATTHQRQSLMEEKARRKCEFSARDTANGSVDSNSDGDDSNSDNHTTCGTLRTRKRKRSPPSNTVSRKRHSGTPNTTSKQHLERAAHAARQQKPSHFRGRPLSTRPSVSQYGSYSIEARHGNDESDESSEESGDHDHCPQNNERLKSTASLDRSRRHKRKRGRSSVQRPPSNTESPFTAPILPQPHAPPRQSRRQLPDITIHPLLSSTAFLTAIFHNCGDMEMLSTSQVVSLVENHVGHETKLYDITIKPFTLGIWILTCFLYCSPDTADLPASRGQLHKAGSQIDQPAPALLSLLAMTTDAATPRDDDLSSDDDGESSGKILSDDDEGHDTPPSSRKCNLWSQEDDDHLLKWKEEGKSWDWICSQLPSRSPGAVRVRWYTKLRGKAQSNLTGSC